MYYYNTCIQTTWTERCKALVCLASKIQILQWCDVTFNSLLIVAIGPFWTRCLVLGYLSSCGVVHINRWFAAIRVAVMVIRQQQKGTHRSFLKYSTHSFLAGARASSEFLISLTNESMLLQQQLISCCMTILCCCAEGSLTILYDNSN